jgi:hypothetical protein
MAAKLYEMRDTAKRLLGDKYAEKMAEYGEILQATVTATKGKKTPLELAIEVCKKPSVSGYETIFIMSAAVELAEPSNAESNGAQHPTRTPGYRAGNNLGER